MLPPLLLAILAAGCASPPDGEFPSLAMRPYEVDDPISDSTEAPEPPPASLPAELAAKVAAFEARAQKADSAFKALLPAVQRRAQAASDARVSSELWVNAQIEVSRLDRSREDAVAAYSDLDRLASEQLDAELQSKSPAYSALLESAQQKLGDIVTSQTGEIERLSRLIGQ